MKKTLIIPLALLLVLVILIGFWSLKTETITSPPPETTPPPSPRAASNRLVWSPSGLAKASGQVPASGQVTKTLAIGPTDHLLVQIDSPSAEIKTVLKDPLGKTVPLSPQSTEQTKIYDLTKDVTGGDWQIVLSNPNPQTSATYAINVPVAAPPLVVSPVVDQTTTGQNLVVSITVEETTLSVTTPVSGAQVTATIISQPGNVAVATIILQEADPENNPGVYTGNYTGDLDSGLYQIEYLIDGENSAGQPFVQTTTGEFYVPPDTSATTTHNLKYDINQAERIRIIGN
jgi:hypothetical protein